MSDEYFNESMLDMYIFETTQNIEQLETAILSSEKSSCYTPNSINEIFRIMHTIKGSSAMMLYNNIASLAHSIEDLFYYLREQKSHDADCSTISDLVLEGVDFIKVELQKIKNGDSVDGDCSILIQKNKEFLTMLKQENPSDCEIEGPDSDVKQQYYIAPGKTVSHSGNFFKATIYFEEGCEMENIRAYSIAHNIREFSEEVFYLPQDIIDNDDSVYVIREQGFKVYLRTDKSYDEVKELFMYTIFLKDLELIQLENDEEFRQFERFSKTAIVESPIKVPLLQPQGNKEQIDREATSSVAQSIISVNVNKLDKLMDLVGEMVIAEAMVTQNPEVKSLELENFKKASRQLHKITPPR
jgi:two-component system chemotaxis sensor kinase CheA